MQGLQGSFLHGQIRFDVHVCCGRAFMTEPQRNDGDIDPRLQKMHGQGMSNDVGCYLTLRKVGLTLARSTDRK